LFRHGFDGLRNESYKVKEFERAFADKMEISYGLAVSSGTAALRVALAAIGIGEGDEVITQSFTFVATAEAIIEAGAIPVCVNIDLTLNMDPSEFESRITQRTRAVIVVHMLGTPARLPEIISICKRHNIYLIEDTAWGCGGKLHGKPLGTWGDVGTYSFDFAKTMTTGEGGMIVFREEEIWKKAAAWHDHGHENNPAVPRWEDGYCCSASQQRGTLGGNSRYTRNRAP
jgi:8-amino-3,8-dideoxy-alpha-D-manno-octulosonate transaminase